MDDDILEDISIDELEIESSKDNKEEGNKNNEINLKKDMNNFKDMENLNEKMLNMNNANNINNNKNKINLDDNQIYYIKEEKKSIEDNNEYDDFNNEIISDENNIKEIEENNNNIKFNFNENSNEKKEINSNEVNDMDINLNINNSNDIQTEDKEIQVKIKKVKKEEKKINNNDNDNNNIIEILKNIMKYTEDEINDLSYELALQYDKRTYFELYLSLLRTKHNFINSFLFNGDYNSKIIKIDLFFIDFASSYIINALFFNDDTMHDIYESKGSFNLNDQLPIAIYSYLISSFINFLLNMFALSNDAIIDFKQNKKIININKRSKKLILIIKIRTFLFFIISSIFLFSFWYYISMFCAIYKNTQSHLLKDTLISFGISMLTPFAFYLLPGFFRIPALSNCKIKRECIYKFSKLLLII